MDDTPKASVGAPHMVNKRGDLKERHGPPRGPAQNRTGRGWQRPSPGAEAGGAGAIERIRADEGAGHLGPAVGVAGQRMDAGRAVEGHRRAQGVDGTVVAGWATPLGGSWATPLAAVWRYDGTAWSGAVDLGTLGGPWSFANAISGDGTVVVGLAQTAGGDDRAFRWTETDHMQSVQALLEAAGVDMTGWELTTAYGVSHDGSVVVGYGNNAGDGQAWVARFASGGTGLITPDEVARSFAGLGALGHTGRAALGGTLSAMSEQALQGTPSCAARAADCPRFSVFAQGGYDSDPVASGRLGLTARLGDGDVVAGAVLGAEWIRTDLYLGGEATMKGGSAGLFVANAPQSGLQWLLGASALAVSGDIERAYLNGAGVDVSRDSTNGRGFGLEARVGWGFSGLLPATTVTPYASLAWSAVRYDGYVETGGAFPATIDAFTDEAGVLRLGADVRRELSPGKWLWGGLAWVIAFPATARTSPAS